MTIWLFVEWGWLVNIFAASSIAFRSALELSERRPMVFAFSRCSPLGHSIRMPAPPFFFFVAFYDEPSVQTLIQEFSGYCSLMMLFTASFRISGV